MGSRGCFSFLASDLGVSPGIYSPSRASCCPEHSSSCLCDPCGRPAAGDGACLLCPWALLLGSGQCGCRAKWHADTQQNFLLRLGVPGSPPGPPPRPRGCWEDPHSHKMCVCKSFRAAELRAFACNHNSHSTHIKDRFHNQSPPRATH